MDQTLFDRLPAAGPVSFRAFNQRFRPLITTDGVARYIRSLVQAGSNLQYQKTAP